MFLTFIAAALTVTGAVALLAVIPTWWMLAIALGVHVAGTVIVFLTIMAATADRTRTASPEPAAQERPSASPTAARLRRAPLPTR